MTVTECPACGEPTAIEPHSDTCPMAIYPVPTTTKESPVFEPVTGDQVRKSPVFAALSPDAREAVAQNAEYRRLQLLGVAPEVIAPLLDYVEALNAKQLVNAERFSHLLNEDGTLSHFFAVDPAATGAGKYLQVVAMEPYWKTGKTVPTSVHSVVNKVTGEVSKSAGWKRGPAKSTSKARKGQPLVAFTLTDPDQCQAVFARMDVYGGYLYSK